MAGRECREAIIGPKWVSMVVIPSTSLSPELMPPSVQFTLYTFSPVSISGTNIGLWRATMSDQYRSKKSNLSLSSWQPSNIRAVEVSNGFFRSEEDLWHFYARKSGGKCWRESSGQRMRENVGGRRSWGFYNSIFVWTIKPVKKMEAESEWS